MSRPRSLTAVFVLFLAAVSARAEATDNLYRSADPLLTAEFSLPPDWRVSEQKGKLEPFTQVLAIGPRNAADSYNTVLLVRAFPLNDKGGRFNTPEQAAEHYVAHVFEGKVVDRGELTVAGQPAIDVTVTYVQPPLRRQGFKPAEVPVKARNVFFRKGSRLYEIAYSADESEYAKSLPAFDRLVATFQV